MPLKRFHLNGHIATFHPQTKKLKLKSVIPSFIKGDVKRHVGLLENNEAKKSQSLVSETRNLTNDADSKSLKK